MNIDQTISGCQAVFDYASKSDLLYSTLLAIFLFFPLGRILLSVMKTFKLRKIILSTRCVKIPKKLAILIKRHAIPVELFVVSKNRTFSAMSIGFFNKRIVISRRLINLLSSLELESVILHEYYHVISNHSLQIFFIEFFTSFFFFLPSTNDLQQYIKLLFEKSADSYAVSVQQTSKYIKKSLGKVIVGGVSPIFPGFSYQILDQRIDSLNLVKTRFRYSKKKLIQTSIILFIFLSLFLANKKYVVASTMEEKIACNIFDCVKDCMVYEITNNKTMSEVNYSINTNFR